MRQRCVHYLFMLPPSGREQTHLLVKGAVHKNNKKGKRDVNIFSGSYLCG